MEPVFKNLGKVRPTVDNNNWSIDNEYNLLTIVYDLSSNKSYISRQPVPANVVIDNREYWLPLGVGRFVDNAIININYLDGVSQELITYTLEEAIARIGDEDKRLGMIISFYGNEASDSHTPGWCLYQFMSDNLNDWDDINAWNSIYYNRNKNVGWFRTESELLAIYPSPHKGDYCYIGTSLLGSFVYRCYENGTWVNTNELASANIGIVIGGNIRISENGTWIVDDEDTGIKAVGTGIERMTYTPSQEDGGINILQVKLTDGTQFSFSIKNGNQGNSGIIVPDLETFLAELVNNLITDDATKALSAAQGVVLNNKISQLGIDIFDLLAKHIVVKQGQKIASQNLCRFYSGYYVGLDGGLFSFSDSYATYYIPVKPNTQYHYGGGILSSAATIAYYDGKKQFLSSAGEFDTAISDYDFTTPANCYYIRASILYGGIGTFYVAANEDYEIEYDVYLFDIIQDLATDIQGVESYAQLNFFDLFAKHIVVKQNQKIAGADICRFENDVYVGVDGGLTQFNDSITTYFIPVKPGVSYHYRNGYLQAAATIAFYNGKKEFVSSLGSFDNVETDYDFVVPANCYYLRASKLVGGIGEFYISSAQDYEIEYDEFLFNWLKELQDILLIKSGMIIQKNEDNTYKDGYYLNDNGEESYFGSPYKYTENYIPVFGNVHYLYEGSLSGWASICFYDKDKNLISTIHPGSETWTEHEFITPANCLYIRCTTMSTCNIYLSEDIIGDKITQWVILLLEQQGILYQSNSIIASDKENTYKDGYYLNPLGGEAYFGYPYKYTENYIFVIPNTKYKYSGSVNSLASIVFYDVNKNYIGSIYPDSETWYEHEFTTPTTCFYIRCTTMSTVDIYCMEVLMGSSFDKEIHNVVSAIRKNKNIGTLNYGKSLIGDVDITNIKKYDYAHIIYYGQSLSCGVDTPSALTTTPISGCYMIGDSLEDYGSGTTKNPLVNIQSEHPVVATVNAFARLYRQFVEPQKDFFGSSCGIGGATITELSKGGTLYNNRFINQINRIKTCVDNEGKTISCPAIVYLQGENDVNPGFTPKDIYKALMLQLKNDMQADIMSKYGQTEKPMFFIYSVSNQFNSQPSMNIPMAQIEFAAENEDVFLLNPYYAMPSYDRYHMSKNGYRWYGSLAAKSIFDVIVKCRNYSTIIPKKFELLSKKELLIRFYVPIEPLVFDSAIIPNAGNNYGFALFLNNTRLDLNKIELYDSNTIKITTYEDIDSGTLEIYYAMAGSIGYGTGNLRDSDSFKAYYNYVDDTGEKSVNNTDMYYHPTQLYGKKYPLYNWCAPFYYQIVNP